MQSLASRRQGRLIGDTGRRDEDLFLFHEVQRRESERKHAFLRPRSTNPDEEETSLASKLQNASIINRDEEESSLASKLRSSPVNRTPTSASSKLRGIDDSFSLELGKNDFDWLLTPPGTPLLTTSNEDPPVADPSVREAAKLIQSLAPLKTSKLGNATELPTRSLREPSSKSTLESSTNASKKRTSLSYSSSTNTGSRYSTDLTGKDVSSTTVKSAASSRSTTPLERQTIQTLHHKHSGQTIQTLHHKHSLSTTSRSSSVSKASSISSKSACSSQGSSPTKYPSWQPGFPVEQPANLRRTSAEQAASSSRSTSTSSRSSFSSTISTSAGVRSERSSATGAQVGGPYGSNRQIQKSRSPISSTGHLGSDIQNIKNANRGPGRAINGRLESSTPIVAGSKMVEKLMQTRKTVNSSKEEQPKKVSSLQPVLQAKQPSKMSALTPNSTIQSRESSGFGRNISKNSLDMALRHMGIRQSVFDGVCPSISNNIASATSYVQEGIAKAKPHRSIAPPLASIAPLQAAGNNRGSGHNTGIMSNPTGNEQTNDSEYKLSVASLQEFEFSISKEANFSGWFNSYDYRDDSVEIMQLFKQGIERFSGCESPLVCQHGRASDCDRCKLGSR